MLGCKRRVHGSVVGWGRHLGYEGCTTKKGESHRKEWTSTYPCMEGVQGGNNTLGLGTAYANVLGKENTHVWRRANHSVWLEARF